MQITNLHSGDKNVDEAQQNSREWTTETKTDFTTTTPAAVNHCDRSGVEHENTLCVWSCELWVKKLSKCLVTQMKESGCRFIVCQFYDRCLELGTETTPRHENNARLPVTDDVTDRIVGYCDEKSRTCAVDQRCLARCHRELDCVGCEGAVS